MQETSASKEAENGEWSVTKSSKRKSNNMDVDIQRKKKRPHFPPAENADSTGGKEMRKVQIPRNRYTPLKENWPKIFSTIVEYLHLSTRFNLKTRMVEIQTCKETKEVGALQKAADFVHAFALGFDVDDAMSLVRLDELFIESFDVKDVKTLHGDHLSRAIGRLVGKGGKTKYTIENATKTRIIVADSKIHIMGSYQHIRAARTTLCNLILGCAPSKAHGTMRHVANRLAESL